MSVNQTPVIPLLTNGPSVQVPVLVLAGPDSDQPDIAATITTNQGGIPIGIATIAAHPTNARAVILTPGGSPGGSASAPLSFFVVSSPAAQVNLQVNFSVSVPPSIRQVVYDAAIGYGPVQP